MRETEGERERGRERQPLAMATDAMAMRTPLLLPPLDLSDAHLQPWHETRAEEACVVRIQTQRTCDAQVQAEHAWRCQQVGCAPDDAVAMHPERMRKMHVACGDCVAMQRHPKQTRASRLAFCVANETLADETHAWMPHAMAFQMGLRLDLDAFAKEEDVHVHVKRVVKPRRGARVTLARVAAPSQPRLAAAMPRSPPDPLVEEPPEAALRRAALDAAERGEAAHAARHAERTLVEDVRGTKRTWKSGDVVRVGREPVDAADRTAVPCIRDVHGAAGPFCMHFVVRTVEAACDGQGDADVEGVLVDENTVLLVRGQTRSAVPGHVKSQCWQDAPRTRRPWEWQRKQRLLLDRDPCDRDQHGPSDVQELTPCARILASLWAPCLGPSTASKRRAPATLVSGGLGSMQSNHARVAARRVGARYIALDARELAAAPGAEDATAAAADRLAAAFESANAFAPAVLCLTYVDALAPSAAAAAATGGGGSGGGHPGGGPTKARAGAWLARSLASLARAHTDIFLVGTCKDPAALPPPLRRVFSHEVRAGGGHGGGDKLAEARLESVQRALPWMTVEEARKVADGAAGLDDASLLSVAAKIDTYLASAERTRGPGSWNDEDLVKWDEQAVQQVRTRVGAGAAAVRVPRVEWSDIGGLEKAKASLRETFELPRQAPMLFMGSGGTGGRALRRRRGVLLWGPPGTGKTMLAKAIAHEGGMSFLAVKGPELLDAYIGESERKVREVFAKARDAAPAVIFFDELDALAPARGGAGGAGGGATDRVVAQLLAELDGVADSSATRGGSAPPQVFVVGATNRPDLIDAALLRPGRFDKMVFVGIAEQAEGRAKVLHALTRKFALADDVDILEVAQKCPERFTGADLYGVAADAWLRAMKRTAAAQAKGLDKVRGLGGLGLHPDGSKHPAGSVVVRQQDLVGALHGRSPSVSAAEYHRYITLAKQYEPDTPVENEE